MVRISPHTKDMQWLSKSGFINSIAVLDLFAVACCLLWSDHIVKLIAN